MIVLLRRADRRKSQADWRYSYNKVFKNSAYFLIFFTSAVDVALQQTAGRSVKSTHLPVKMHKVNRNPIKGTHALPRII